MRVLRFTVALIASVLSFAGSASAEAVKIGVILSYSGFLAQAGQSMEKGLDLYVKTHGKDLPPDVTLDLIRRDDTSSNPEVGRRLAQELIARDRVQMITGVVSSPIASAIAPLTAEAKVPFVIMNAAGSAIPRLSPYITRVSFTLWQQAYPMGKWAAQQGWKSGYTAVSDYIPGHDAEAGFARGFADGGGTSLRSLRMPPNLLDFSAFLQRMNDDKPDFIFVFVPGGKYATAFFKSWSDLGLKDAGVKIIATQDLVTDDELPNMGDLPIGVVSTGTYSIAGKRPQNREFLDAWAREYGTNEIPNYIAVGGWDGMAAIFDVIKKTNGRFDSDQAMAILQHWQDPNSPRGPIAIDPATRDIVQNVYIRRVEKVEGHLANVEFETIPLMKDPWKELNPVK